MGQIMKDGMYGLVIGDALGVPVEFASRAKRKENPVLGMRAYGTHYQPAGTWSDDSSMALATLDSIRSVGKIDEKDIMDRFLAWRKKAEYTPFGEVFDIGNATAKAIQKYEKGSAPLESGGATEYDNGNGSLMRILPVCIYLVEQELTLHGQEEQTAEMEQKNVAIIHNCSALTHAHLRSKMACGIYFYLVRALVLESGSVIERLQKGIDQAWAFYQQKKSNLVELDQFQRMVDVEQFSKIPECEIKSSGYVVDTLEAAVWCLINSCSYKDAVLKAVNLGDDTDTVGAVAGGLAGLYYEFTNIPETWINVIQRREWIDEMLSEFESCNSKEQVL